MMGMQNLVAEDIFAGYRRMRRHTDRLEEVLEDAASVDRRIRDDVLVATGFRPEGRVAGVLRSIRGPNLFTPPAPPGPAELSHRLDQGRLARRALQEDITRQLELSATTRAETSAQIREGIVWVEDWLRFVRGALEVCQNEYRCSLKLSLRALECKRNGQLAEFAAAREALRLEMECVRNCHLAAMETQQVNLSCHIQRRQCEAGIDARSREIDLKERAERHHVQLERARLAVEARRGDQQFLSGIIGSGLQILASALL